MQIMNLWYCSCATIKKKYIYIYTYSKKLTAQMGYGKFSHRYLKKINCEMNCESSKQFSNSPAQHGGSVLKTVVDLNVCVAFSAAFACVFLPYSKIRQVKRNKAFELP